MALVIIRLPACGASLNAAFCERASFVLTRSGRSPDVAKMLAAVLLHSEPGGQHFKPRRAQNRGTSQKRAPRGLPGTGPAVRPVAASRLRNPAITARPEARHVPGIATFSLALDRR